MDEVFQTRLPVSPWAEPATRRLPGIQALDPADWLEVDEAYAGQMALRDRLIAEREAEVHALLPEAAAAADELYRRVLAELPRLGYTLAGDRAQCPDGRAVTLDPARPLVTLGRLCQEDFCLLQPGPDGEHVLTGAILCFPAGWVLAEKIGRPLMRIHRPVRPYTEDIGRRVQRLFDAIRPERPLWRANAHHSRAPLYHPVSEAQRKVPGAASMPYVRSERQCLLRLPETGAVVFSIHTYRVRKTDLTEAQARGFAAQPIHGHD